MAEYEEMVAADYDSDDSGADTDEEVTNGTAMMGFILCDSHDEKQPGHLNTNVDLDKAYFI